MCRIWWGSKAHLVTVAEKYLHLFVARLNQQMCIMVMRFLIHSLISIGMQGACFAG